MKYKTRELYVNSPKKQEERKLWQVARATVILEYLEIPTYLTVYRRNK